MTNWAQRGKEALATVSAVPSGMKRYGGGNGEQIVTFYQFNAPKKANERVAVLTSGTTLEGVYAGSYVNKTFGNTTHKLRTANGLVALPNAAQLNNALQGISEGVKLSITYTGKQAIKTGKYAGKQSHTFDVFGE